MQTGIFAFLWLLSTFSFSVSETRRRSVIDATASRPSSAVSSPSSSSSAPRRWNSSATRRPSRTDAVQTKYITKIQVEDLDEEASSSVECVRVRELNFCGDSDAGTGRHPGAFRTHSFEWEEEEEAAKVGRLSPKLFSLLLDSPSCRRRLRPFLCVALTPACSLVADQMPASLPPCRTLCSVAADGCRDALEARGIDWPAQWTCDQYPVEGLCLDRPPHQDTGLKIGLDYLNFVSGSKTFVAEFRGSLQPPPSSVFDGDLASPHETVGPRGQAVPRHRHRRRLADDSRFFGGWVDVQGLGHTNDYCRVIGTDSKDRVLSCALNGTESGGHQQSYVSKQGFDAGRPRSGFMEDVDGDRRDDYCRCVGNDERSHLICMKAGERGFYGSKMQPGSQYTIRIETDYCRRNGNAFN